ncbi:unnamed protein product [Choristocarpus tenellus]
MTLGEIRKIRLAKVEKIRREHALREQGILYATFEAVKQSMLQRLVEDLEAEKAETANKASAGGKGKRVAVQGEKDDMVFVHLKAMGGPHKGASFTLKLVAGGEPAMLGRSTTKKFKEKGVSLPRDKEVSTSHGKLYRVGAGVAFVDVGSSNGTVVDGEEAVKGKIFEVKTGMEILIGQTPLLLEVE